MNTELYSAFERTIESRIISKVPQMPDHRFSLRFRRRMKNMIRSVNSEAAPHRRVSAKRFFAITATVLITASVAALSAGGVRSILRDLIMKNFPEYTNVAFTDTEDSPDSLKYRFSFDIPDGFELYYEDDINEMSPWIYCEYRNSENYIGISQYVKSQYDINVNTENRQMSSIEINGHDGYMVGISEKEYFITWDNGDYILEISSSLGKNATIDIAKSVQKRE